MYNLYDRIRFYCEQEGITPNALFIKLGYSKSTISRLRVGKTKTLSAQVLTDTLRTNILKIEKEISRLKKQINDLADQEILISEDMCYEFLKEFTGTRFNAKKILQTFVSRVIVSSVETDVWDVSVEYAFGNNTPWDQKGSEKFSLVTQCGQTSSPILVGNGTILCRYILKKPAHGEQASFLKEDIDLTAFQRLKAVLPYHTFMILS